MLNTLCAQDTRTQDICPQYTTPTCTHAPTDTCCHGTSFQDSCSQNTSPRHMLPRHQPQKDGRSRHMQPSHQPLTHMLTRHQPSRHMLPRYQPTIHKLARPQAPRGMIPRNQFPRHMTPVPKTHALWAAPKIVTPNKSWSFYPKQLTIERSYIWATEG